MGKPTGKVVSILAAGPLGPFADAYREQLTRRGYAPVTMAKHMIHLGHLSRWLEVRGMDPGQPRRRQGCRGAGVRAWPSLPPARKRDEPGWMIGLCW